VGCVSGDAGLRAWLSLVGSGMGGISVRIAMIGTRGVPARYGGFETAVEEVGRRLVARGHEVVVYSRGDQDQDGRTHLGMRRVVLPAVRHRAAETLSHSALSVAHLVAHRVDAAIVFNAANAVLLPVIRAARIPVAVHVDGLEWKRAKWGRSGRRWYLQSERMAVRWADELIADSGAIQDYYRARYSAGTRLLSYGAELTGPADAALLQQAFGLPLRGFHLVVARLEPENNVDLIMRGYRASAARLPLVVVGSVPYASDHERSLQEIAGSDPRIRMVGGVYDQDQLNALYAGAASYLHGHSVGGTNPSLLRAMGAGAATLANDIDFNRDVLGDTGRYFRDPESLAPLLQWVEADPGAARQLGEQGRSRAARRYVWDDVAAGYEQLCGDLAARLARRPVTAPTRLVPRPATVDLRDDVAAPAVIDLREDAAAGPAAEPRAEQVARATDSA
jgi:glycosyltransferase involved in cell wall biosynthesis